MQTLFYTLVQRPYVVAFLLTFLLLATFHFGLIRALCWLVIGYGIAFFSEYSSIHNGFPYGMYHYLYDALDGELLLVGVPIWDSASYAFIAYASYSLAWFFVENCEKRLSLENYIVPASPVRILFLGAVFMMLVDVIIDPVAHLGERWFLGKIYFYPNGGIYFGVPISNFLGWFLVAFLILGTYQFLDKKLFTRFQFSLWGVKRFSLQGLLGPLFYFSILFFNIIITFTIDEKMLGWVDIMILLPILSLFINKVIAQKN